MATVRLEFDLDSDVYPELYRALAGLRSTQAQAERLRQLAAQGLVWENVRIYGAGAIGPTPSVKAVTPPPAAARPAPAPRAKRAAEPAPAPSRQAKDPRGRGQPAEPRSARARGADFVDLAIDAVDVDALPEADPEAASLLSQSELDRVARELPVLVDVVAETDIHGEPIETPPPLYMVLPPSSAAGVAPAGSRGTDDTGREEALHELAGGSDDALHLKSLAQKPAARSRLLRMKERGLFKNG